MNRYLDLIGEMTAGLYGHSHPIIRDAIVSAAYKTGLNLGATTTAEAKFADQICQRIPSIEQLRFCNSGTEANLYALSIARRVTGRSKVVVFTGGYHGGVLSFVHGIAANNVDKADWILGTYNNGEAARKLISENKDTAAAVLVEAMQGAGGCIQGTAGFLHAIQQTAKETGVIFILDEVMTSRLAPGGLQSTTFHPASQAPLHPDITTLGKYIAGGITIGAFGGRSDLLAVYNPRAVVASGRGETLIQHSGTFNNNTIAMSVGYVALSAVYTSEACIALNSLGDWFRRSLQELCQGKKMIVTGVGAVCNIHFLSCSNSGFEDAYVTRVTCTEELEAKSGSFESFLKDLLWFYVVERGYWMAQRGMLSLTLGTTMEELQGFLQVIEGFLNEFDDFVK